MRNHKGEHPRFGATDVCPLFPSEISVWTKLRHLPVNGERIGKDSGSDNIVYENAALKEERRNLANCRSGEYEGLPEKLKILMEPDFWPG